MARANSEPIDGLLEKLWDRQASDLLLTAGSPPLMRVDGELVRIDQPTLAPTDVEAILSKILPDDMWQRYQKVREIDFSFNWRSTARFRANAFFQRGSMGLSIRVIPYGIATFAELGLPSITERLVSLPHGLVLVTGATGSGKSTTLASMLDYINEHRACHILTLEDPIEYVHRHKKAAVNQREIGEDTSSFTSGLRAALREDPDVLLVGEMRDLETIRIALTVAETGHLVFATLHTNDTAQAIDRIVDVFPGDQQQQIKVQLANSLQAIYHQQLLPKIGGGRVAAFEVLVANHAVRNLIKEGKSTQIRNVVMTGQKEGMQTLESHLSELVERGVIDFELARLRSTHSGEVRPPLPPPVVGQMVPEMAMNGRGRSRR